MMMICVSARSYLGHQFLLCLQLLIWQLLNGTKEDLEHLNGTSSPAQGPRRDLASRRHLTGPIEDLEHLKYLQLLHLQHLTLLSMVVDLQARLDLQALLDQQALHKVRLEHGVTKETLQPLLLTQPLELKTLGICGWTEGHNLQFLKKKVLKVPTCLQQRSSRPLDG